MKRTLTPTLLGGLLLATSLVPALAQTSSYGIEVPTGQRHIAAGTTVKVKLLQDVTSASAQSGDRVRVQVEDGDASGLPAGTIFNGRVASVLHATPKSAGALRLRFGGTASSSAASADLTGQKPVADKSSQYGSIGAGAGALLGLSRHRRLGDAIEGAVVGGAAGLGANQLQKKSATDVSLKRGQDITITLTRPLTLRTQVVTPY